MTSDSWDGVIPIELLESEDYKALSTKEKENFSARLRYCDEIVEKACLAVTVSDSDLLEAIDDIELDALSILSLGDVQTKVSPYRIHSSWTFECDRQAMVQYVVPDAAQFLGSGSSALMASSKNAKEWLLKWCHVLRLSLSKFGTSSSFTEAVTHLIVIDALVSSYLIFAATARLNGAIG